MINGISFPMPDSSHLCIVCDKELTQHERIHPSDTPYTVCRSFQCLSVMNQQATMQPAAFKHYLEFNKRLIHERHESDLARQKHKAGIIKREQEEEQAVLESFLSENPEYQTEDLYVISIPLGGLDVVSMQQERRGSYINHIHSIIDEAAKCQDITELTCDEHYVANDKLKDVDARLALNPALHQMSDKVCAMCKGGCCAKGKEHGYLSVVTMKRYMDANPGISAEEIAGLYLSRLNDETVEGGCINQTGTGCALPRALRSDICNAYYCDGLKKWHKTVSTSDEPGILLVVQRAYNNYERFDDNARREIVGVKVVSYE